MARVPVFPPVIKLHRKSGQARVWWDGKWHYLGPHDSPEAKTAYAALLARISGAGPQHADRKSRPHVEGLEPPNVVTVEEVLACWTDAKAGKLSERGQGRAHYERAMTFLLKLFRDLPAAQFRRRHLSEVQRLMADEGLASSTVNRHVTRLRTIWRWAEQQDMVPEGRWHHLLTLDGISKNDPSVHHAPPRQSASWDDLRKLCRVVSPVVRAMLLTQWWTAARTGELVSMRRGDVVCQKGSWSYVPRRHKNDWRGHARIIALGPKAMAVLRPWLEACTDPDDFVFPAELARRKKSGPRPLHAYYRDRGYTTYSYAQAVRRGCVKAGVSLQPYDLRHAAADRIRRAAGPHAARTVLGQKHLSTTDLYGDALDHEHAQDVQKRIG